ncbi:MAG: hypothetical protein E7Z93_03065 [Cyanobacteria bacterium SIG32]|nr:hypothetical protein [Cyanobacteria bacterium SIG32]
MKKILLVLVALLFSVNQGFALNCLYNCVEPYDLSHGASRFMSAITGSNFLAEKIAKSILRKEIMKNTDGKFSVKVDSYSVKDLKKGIFKSVKVKGKEINADGVHFTKLNMKTLCDFNYISMKNPNNPVFMEDLPLEFSVVMSEDDLNKTMQTVEYEKLIDKLNSYGKGYGLFKIESTRLKIKDDKLYYILQVALPFAKNLQDVVIMSDLKVYKGDIDFANTKLINKKISIDMKKIDRIVNYLNPLDFSLNILENKDAILTVQNINVKDDKVFANGLIVIPKDIKE